MPKNDQMPRILIIQSDPALLPLLESAFPASAYTILVCSDGADANRRVEHEQPDLVVLDWSMTGVPAAEVYRRIRLFDAAGRLPVILVGAPPAEIDIAQQPVAVLAKPCSVDDLVAAARALLDRTNPRAADAILVVSEFELDRERHRLRRGGKYIHLGPIEYRLIEYLMTHSGELLTRPQIVNGVWGNGAAVEERAVDVQLKRLRAAINSGRRKRDPIRAVRGLGYIFG